jgi:hypothetical protein
MRKFSVLCILTSMSACNASEPTDLIQRWEQPPLAVSEIHVGAEPRNLDVQMQESMRAQGLEGYHTHYIEPDGSCWARALWQATLAQVLDDPARFDQFAAKVQATSGDFANDDRFMKPTQVLDVMSILTTLKDRPQQERIAFLNSRDNDAQLNMFMRKVVAATLRRDDAEKSADTQAYINEIEHPKRPGSAFEILAFARYFDLTIHEITRTTKGSAVLAKLNIYNKMAPPCHHSKPAVMMYAVNSMHYEVLALGE